MKFSEYVILAKPGLMMDPLGFLSPAAKLQDTLFKQFTVLTNHPAYHGLLALTYQVLQGKGLAPGHPSFALEFRKLEILWGLVNAVSDEGVLNVTKYRPLVDTEKAISLSAIPKSHGIYDRLAYGTLGHYSAPSSVWGLVENGGLQLSENGRKLGDAFAQRRGVSLLHSLEKWYRKTAFSKEDLVELGVAYAVSEAPGSDEQSVWRNVIAHYGRSAPHTACYWQAPLSHEELSGFNTGPEQYAYLFPTLQERYQPLASRLWQVETFQRLSALTQYIFEREYLLLAEDKFDCPAGDTEKALVATMKRLAAAYVEGPFCQDAKGLFKSLAGVASYQDAADIILRHHVRHQKSKGVSPFLEDGRLLVQERFRMADFAALWDSLRAAPTDASALDRLVYRYRRDWHFSRARTYYDYAGLTA